MKAAENIQVTSDKSIGWGNPECKKNKLEIINAKIMEEKFES